MMPTFGPFYFGKGDTDLQYSFPSQGVIPADREGFGPRQFARCARVRRGQVRGQVGQRRGIEVDHDDFRTDATQGKTKSPQLDSF